MTPTPQKLTPEMIEAVAHIVMHGNRKQTLDQARAGVVDHQDHAFLVLTAASKHTGADDLYEALVADKEAIEKCLIEILSSAAEFISDPPDSDFQEGYLSAIKVIAEESLQRLADRVSAIDATLAKHRALMGMV